MKRDTFKFDAGVWLYPGDAAWHFVTVPKKVSANINERFGTMRRGWGSLPVEVKVGKTAWSTSIFIDRKSNTYLLPLKSRVRQAEGVIEGDRILVTLRVCPYAPRRQASSASGRRGTQPQQE